MPEVKLSPLPFDEAIGFFRKKSLAVVPDPWRGAWAWQHAHAFTVSKVTSMEILEDIRQAVDAAIADGVPLKKFQDDLSDLLTRKGWMGKGEFPPWRLETIYRTNVQSAYQAGRFKQLLEVSEKRPYWMYDAVDDARTRPTHAAHDNKVYRFDHPFWDRWYPPNGYNCRCSVRTLSERDMERRGLVEQTQGTSLKPDEGFDYNVGMQAWKPDFEKYAPSARRILEASGADAPKTMDELSESLNRLKDGFAETGMIASKKPIRILLDPESESRGWSKYKSGVIGLHPQVHRSIENILKQGSALLAEEVDDVKTLVHEFGHQLGHPLDLRRYGKDEPYTELAQTVNDLWARHTTANIMQALKLKYNAKEALRLKRFHPSAYQSGVDRMRTILQAAGIGEAEEKILMDNLNLTVSPKDYSARMWEAIRKHRPKIREDIPFGRLLIEKNLVLYLELLGKLMG